MILNKYIKREIKAHALEQNPQECCGLVLRVDDELDVFPCENSSVDRDKYFRIPAGEYIKAKRIGEIKAVYHSHCNDLENFSEFDKLNSQNHNIEFILYVIKNDNFLSYLPNCEYNSYVGRELILGQQDCWSLVRDFYKQELNIEIKDDYHRDESWLEDPKDTMDKCHEDEGFEKVDDLKIFDCVFFRMKKTGPSSHVGIYLGNDLILHQMGGVNGYSKIEEYSPRWEKFSNYITRHKDLK
jgi:proteasome lid subunit RPN8/RPN11